MNIDNEKIIRITRRWVDAVVVNLNLCPFAGRELRKNRVRFVVTNANTEEQLLMALEAELQLLGSEVSIETTLLIHPQALPSFYDYNQFLNLSDGLLEQMNLIGIYQIASFHPNYRFDGTDPDATENYTNRSPYPMLHIIREESLERAIADYPDVGQVPARNIVLINRLGRDRLQALLQACFDEVDNTKH